MAFRWPSHSGAASPAAVAAATAGLPANKLRDGRPIQTGDSQRL